MNIMKNILIYIAVALSIFMVEGCSRVRDIKVTSCKLISVSPSGLKSMEGILEVGVDNPSVKFRLDDIEGKIYRNGEILAYITADPVEIAGRTRALYDVKGKAAIAPGVSVLTLLGMVRGVDPKEFTIDISAKVKARGIGKTVERKGIPLTDLMDEVNK